MKDSGYDKIFIFLPITFELVLIEEKSYHKAMKPKLLQHRSGDTFLAIFNSSYYRTDKQRLVTMGSGLPLCNYAMWVRIQDILWSTSCYPMTIGKVNGKL